jgi:xylose isomerase
MDVFARSLIAADRILNESDYRILRKKRYSSFDEGEGKFFESGALTLEDLREIALSKEKPSLVSGRQELYENLVNQFI